MQCLPLPFVRLFLTWPIVFFLWSLFCRLRRPARPVLLAADLRDGGVRGGNRRGELHRRGHLAHARDGDARQRLGAADGHLHRDTVGDSRGSVDLEVRLSPSLRPPCVEAVQYGMARRALPPSALVHPKRHTGRASVGVGGGGGGAGFGHVLHTYFVRAGLVSSCLVSSFREGG